MFAAINFKLAKVLEHSLAQVKKSEYDLNYEQRQQSQNDQPKS